MIGVLCGVLFDRNPAHTQIHTCTHHTAAKQISEDKLATHTVNVTKLPQELTNAQPIYTVRMRDQPLQAMQTHTCINCKSPPLNKKRTVCEVPTSAEAACQLKLPLFRLRLFVRLKANVISDTQQEPSEHPTVCSEAVQKQRGLFFVS